MRISRTGLSFEIMRSPTRSATLRPSGVPDRSATARPASARLPGLRRGPPAPLPTRPLCRPRPCPRSPLRGDRALASPPHATPSEVSEPLSGLIGSRQYPRSLSPFLRRSRIKAPSLRRHYPASSLLRAYPPPCRPKLALAGFRLARARHRQGFPCCIHSPARACCRHYPGGDDRPCFVARPTGPYRSLAAFPVTSAGRPPH